jgi:UDP-GlcNAc3NAcA epimerase
MALDRANVHPSNSNLHFIAPVSYLEMVALEKHAALVVTDSGGVQKEAFFHGVTCVTLRHETEWNELVDAGWNVLAPPTSAQVIKDAILDSLKPTQHTASPENLYGAGEAGKQIVELLCA